MPGIACIQPRMLPASRLGMHPALHKECALRPEQYGGQTLRICCVTSDEPSLERGQLLNETSERRALPLVVMRLQTRGVGGCLGCGVRDGPRQV